MRRPLGLAALGLATPIGTGAGAVADALFAGTRDGLRPRSGFVPGRAVHVGSVDAPLPPVPAGLETYDCRNNRLLLLALEQIRDAVETAAARHGRHRIAVIIGTSTSGMAEAEAGFAAMRRDGAWTGPFHYDQLATGGPGEFAARALDLPGPAYTVATACSSSGKVFASARRLIRSGLCDAAVVGGAYTLCGTTLGGFSALEAVSAGLCNPFSANRDGINIGEAAAVFLLTAEDAPVRLLGVGESSDAHHVSAPDPEGHGALAAMRAALDDAGLTPSDIAYVNLHGTATALNDSMEGKAVHALFGDATPCSSTKAMTGHTLGAAGACEAAFLWLALHPAHNPDGRLPPHLWDGAPDPEIPPLNLIGPGATFSGGLPAGPAAMLSNSFAFGGSNVALVLGRGEWR
ncbi:3-oxoacyl-[acyl-carrier-protein] synthase-1 [Azospirillum brasilense]|uniref:Beta-ketoacyl synthase n=1 Tax=Azospirillum baldaniorum TaxID=1064539 RepID=A0A9P1JPH9_9PROT|nr:beta-ketoacyl-[acyl-carrier-protein] synthase family protein [Azospirillum baldaniorum]TWA78743.1 3-oxoacyl-[acyl-carrier-protein] synthase-1 [Azospirillum brasilense]CCC97291.1 beta-ketoacyl synthase [Azospirillum baldaniorum]